MSNNLSILIVDDDQEDIDIFIDAVGQLDESIQCISAFNGREALQLLAQDFSTLPHFIFLDLNMPRLNGKECLALIKKDARLVHIPIIIYTTSKAAVDREDTLLLGAAAFITKPVKLDDLKDAIARAIGLAVTR